MTPLVEELHNSYGEGGQCSFHVVHVDEKEFAGKRKRKKDVVKKSYNTWCHGRLVNFLHCETKQSVHSITTSLWSIEGSEEQAKIYFKWLFSKKCPWSPLLKNFRYNKDKSGHTKSVTIYGLADMPPDYLVNFLQATRWPMENPANLKFFAKMVELGVNGTDAFILANSFAMEKETVFTRTPADGHIPIVPVRCSYSNLRNKTPKLNSSLKKPGPSFLGYGGLALIWNSGSGLTRRINFSQVVAKDTSKYTGIFPILYKQQKGTHYLPLNENSIKIYLKLLEE